MRVAVPRDKDVEALRTIVKESPIPVIADIHFNHTLALKAIDAGADCIRLNPEHRRPGEGRRGSRKGHQGERPDADRRQLRLASQAPPRLEKANPVDALVQAAVEFVDLMERLLFENFKVSIKSATSRT